MVDPALIDARDSFGNTPLLAALSPSSALEPQGVMNSPAARARIQRENSARQAIVSALLTQKASVNLSGPEGVQPLMRLAAWGFSAEADRSLATRMLALGASINARDDSGTTALMFAARRGKDGLVKLLLSRGADPALKNCHDEDAASLAEHGGFARLARVLKATGARSVPANGN